MRDVAERAGVAMSSVSRVLSGHPDVSPKMHADVMAAVAELGYRPDMLAQGLRSRKTFSVGFTVSDIGNPVLAEAVTGAERELRRAGYSLLLTDSEGDPRLDADQIRLLEQRRVDGLILSLAEERHKATREMLQNVQVPVVLLDRDFPPRMRFSRVCFDHRSGMADATAHLVELGHREIALITGGPSRPERERRHGVEDALRRLAPSANCRVVNGPFSLEHGYRATGRLLETQPRPTAIIAAGNALMRGSLRALHERGIALGRDLSFVGTDDVAVAEFHQPQIAVVRRDMVAAGAAAARLLLELIGGFKGVSEVMLPTEFIPRPSCQQPAAH